MLAKTLVSIGQGAGLPITALLTDMNEVLGRTVGHALEMGEVVAYLTTSQTRGRGCTRSRWRWRRKCCKLGGLCASADEGRKKAQSALDGGRVAEIFSRMVSALGGPRDYLENYARYRLPAKVIKPFRAVRAGTITGMDARAVGVAAIALGGGRRTASDVIDPTVGFSDFRPVGTRVEAGDVIALVHARNAMEADAAIAELQEAVRISDDAPALQPLISARITAQTPEYALDGLAPKTQPGHAAIGNDVEPDELDRSMGGDLFGKAMFRCLRRAFVPAG